MVLRPRALAAGERHPLAAADLDDTALTGEADIADQET
jgi:hypothetical protein